MGGAPHLVHDASVHGRISDDAACADVVASGLELRLDERDYAAAWREQRWHDRQNMAKAQ